MTRVTPSEDDEQCKNLEMILVISYITSGIEFRNESNRQIDRTKSPILRTCYFNIYKFLRD